MPLFICHKSNMYSDLPHCNSSNSDCFSFLFFLMDIFLFLIVKQINEVDSDTVMFEDDDDVTLRELPEEDIDAANLHILHELEEV